MQTATCWVALGGDTGNTVPKFDVTPAEIAVLQLIHGSDAVFDISPGPDVNRSNRDERSRLQAFYGKPEGSREPSAVNVLFPGIGARLPETFDELELDESFFKATERATTKPAAAAVAEEVDDTDADDANDAPEPKPVKMTAKQAKAAKAAEVKAAKDAKAAELKAEQPAIDPKVAEAIDNDGIDDMDDAVDDKGIFK